MRNTCIVLFAAVSSLLALGLVMLLSLALGSQGQGADGAAYPLSWFGTQLLWMTGGLVVLLGAAFSDYRRWFVFAHPASFRRVQPGQSYATEIAAAAGERHSRGRTLLLTAFVLIAVLVYARSDPNALPVIVLVGLILMSLGGARRWAFAAVSALVLGAGVQLVSDPLRWVRLQFWLFGGRDDSDVGSCRSLADIALSRGGWTGVGLGHGEMRSAMDLPVVMGHSIALVIGEELGLATILGILVAFTALVAAGLRVSRRAPDRFGSLLGVGIVSVIGLQALFSLAVNAAGVPLRPTRLPFVSCGGSNVFLLLAGVGLLLSIARHARRSDRIRP